MSAKRKTKRWDSRPKLRRELREARKSAVKSLEEKLQAQLEETRVRTALRDLIALRDAPDEGKWTAATLRRLDGIRAIAGLPPKTP